MLICGSFQNVGAMMKVHAGPCGAFEGQQREKAPAELVLGAVAAVEVVEVERHVALGADAVREGRQPHARNPQ